MWLVFYDKVELIRWKVKGQTEITWVYCSLICSANDDGKSSGLKILEGYTVYVKHVNERQLILGLLQCNDMDVIVQITFLLI